MAMNSLQDLLEEQIADLYSAEQQLLEALPKMADAASDKDLKAAFKSHLEETEGHVERLEEVFELLGEEPETEHCKAMEGLIKEGDEVLEEDGKATVKDAALIAAAQRVEHYEIAAYGTVRAFADALGLEEIRDLFDETLDEESAADEKLTEVAKDVNKKAKGKS